MDRISDHLGDSASQMRSGAASPTSVVSTRKIGIIAESKIKSLMSTAALDELSLSKTDFSSLPEPWSGAKFKLESVGKTDWQHLWGPAIRIMSKRLRVHCQSNGSQNCRQVITPLFRG